MRALVAPFPIILSAPSGTGKTTLARRLLATRADVGYSVSATTRLPRHDEVADVSYHFMSPDTFEMAVQCGEFAEHAIVHGNHYGTLRREVLRVLGEGKHVVMDIDVQGAAQFMLAFPDAVSIFVLPPSGQTLVSRLRGRGTEGPEAVAQRLRDALLELTAVDRFEYVVVNDDLDRAVAQVSRVIDAEAVRRARSTYLSGLVKDIVSTVRHELDHLTEEVPDARVHT